MLKLMVVDDEVEICDFVKSFFSDRNFEVFTAYNGEEAMSLYEVQKPDIILLDMMMPVMDGMQALKELRMRGSVAKILMVTAIDASEKIDEANRYGAAGYVTKPLSLEELEKSVFSIAEEIADKAA